MELFIVHEGGQREQYLSQGLFAHLDSLRPGQIINDAAAQTIAAWFHTPESKLSTVLSTMGKVDRRMTRETFATIDEYRNLDTDDRRALDALTAYIVAKIATAPSSYRMCACDDCSDATVGIVGELCHECETAGCTIGEGDECQRDDAYGTEDDPCTDDTGECVCLYCIPGN